MNPHPATQARHGFAGTLVEANAEPLQGIHQLSVRLLDDDGTSHIAYVVYGRSETGARLCERDFSALQIGQRYHGQATLQRRGEPHTYHFGSVSLAPDRRRPRVLTLAPATPPATTGAAA